MKYPCRRELGRRPEEAMHDRRRILCTCIFCSCFSSPSALPPCVVFEQFHLLGLNAAAATATAAAASAAAASAAASDCRKNCDPYKDETVPEAPTELVAELSRRYVMLYEIITGQVRCVCVRVYVSACLHVCVSACLRVCVPACLEACAALPPQMNFKQTFERIRKKTRPIPECRVNCTLS